MIADIYIISSEVKPKMFKKWNISGPRSPDNQDDLTRPLSKICTNLQWFQAALHTVLGTVSQSEKGSDRPGVQRFPSRSLGLSPPGPSSIFNSYPSPQSISIPLRRERVPPRLEPPLRKCMYEVRQVSIFLFCGLPDALEIRVMGWSSWWWWWFS